MKGEHMTFKDKLEKILLKYVQHTVKEDDSLVRRGVRYLTIDSILKLIDEIIPKEKISAMEIAMSDHSNQFEYMSEEEKSGFNRAIKQMRQKLFGDKSVISTLEKTE